MAWELGGILRGGKGPVVYGGYESCCCCNCAWWFRGMDCLWERRGECDDDDVVSANGEDTPAGDDEGELAGYTFGASATEAAGGASCTYDCECGASWGRYCGRSVTVLDDEALEGDEEGRCATFWFSTGSCWEGGGGDSGGEERSSSSGLAMRSPPRVWERLRSPFIVSWLARGCCTGGKRADGQGCELRAYPGAFGRGQSASRTRTSRRRHGRAQQPRGCASVGRSGMEIASQGLRWSMLW